MKTASWVIVEIKTGKAVFETCNAKTAAIFPRYNSKYKSVPVFEYLQNLNRKIKNESL